MNNASARRYRWEEMPREALSPLIARRLISGERVMLAHVYLERGAVVPKHAHENEQLTYLLEGSLRFWLGEDGSEVVDGSDHDPAVGEDMLLLEGEPAVAVVRLRRKADPRHRGAHGSPIAESTLEWNDAIGCS